MKNHDIKRIVDLRESLGNRNYVVYRKLTTGEGFRAAVSVSKKFGSAVERNYARRCVREILRGEIVSLKGTRIVVVVKPPSKDLAFQEKKDQLLRLLRNVKTPVLNKKTYTKHQEEK